MSKNSGGEATYGKIAAARALGIEVVMIRRPALPEVPSAETVDALEQGLGGVARHAIELGASVHMPRIGCGLAGGKWERVEPIVRRTLIDGGIAVTVYDFDSAS